MKLTFCKVAKWFKRQCECTVCRYRATVKVVRRGLFAHRQFSATKSANTASIKPTLRRCVAEYNLRSLLPDTMSVTSVQHPTELRRHSSLTLSEGYSSSVEELHNLFNNTDTVFSIEELRLQYKSCFTCGVSWYKEHVSLDCRECGGYPLERPCPDCDGKCTAVWKRDLEATHATSKAQWEGQCSRRSEQCKKSEDEARLCSQLEKLVASS